MGMYYGFATMGGVSLWGFGGQLMAYLIPL